MGWQNNGRLWRNEGVRGGAVCIDGTGIAVTFIAGRFSAGESVDSLMKDYGLKRADIEAALRCVVTATYLRRGGLPAKVERRMEEGVPLLRRKPATAAGAVAMAHD